jgi:hypothetical protein
MTVSKMNSTKKRRGGKRRPGVANWTVELVGKWLACQNLEQYQNTFQRENIDGKVGIKKRMFDIWEWWEWCKVGGGGGVAVSDPHGDDCLLRIVKNMYL